jgi:hypothetical protein
MFFILKDPEPFVNFIGRKLRISPIVGASRSTARDGLEQLPGKLPGRQRAYTSMLGRCLHGSI